MRCKLVKIAGESTVEINLRTFAFHVWRQAIVDSWVPLLDELERPVPGIRFDELATIQRLAPLCWAFVNKGMRAGNCQRVARERTPMFYVDLRAFGDAPALPGDSAICLAAAAGVGNVL